MAMDQADLTTLLNHLICDWESEAVEFKRGRDGFSSSDLGKYASALANEANLRGRECGWLVFGVDDKTRAVVGSTDKEDPAHLQADKVQVLNGTGKAQCVKTRAFDDQHYEEMIVEFLRQFGQASRRDLEELLKVKLSDALDQKQKIHKIGNLLSALRRKGRIRNFGSKAAPEWRLLE